MASTDFWKALVKVLAVNESNALASLDDYLANEAHPDREEVMTLCLKWHAHRTQRRLLLANVEQARVYGQFMDQPLSEEAETLLESEM